MADFRKLFNGAIEIQRGIIADAERTIEHYERALEEMDKQENIVEAQVIEIVEN